MNCLEQRTLFFQILDSQSKRNHRSCTSSLNLRLIVTVTKFCYYNIYMDTYYLKEKKMKNKLVVLFVLAALLVSLIPVSVFAAEPMELKVFVRNATGGVVDLRLTDANGDFQYLTLDPGVSELALMEGKYEYYALTPCGVQVGVWNLNVSKQLMIRCDGGMLNMNLSKRCDGGWLGTLYYDSINNIHLYVEKDWTNLSDYGDGYFSGEVYDYFGYWPQWESRGPVCWSDIGFMDGTYWEAGVWYDNTEW